MLIRLGANYLAFTLTEKVTITSPDFILILVNDSTRKKAACKLGTNLSSYTSRYDRFLVTVKDNPTALNSEIELDHYGWHKYFIYESEDASTFNYSGVDNLDLETMTGEVENGKIEYVGAVVDKPYYVNRKESVVANGD